MSQAQLDYFYLQIWCVLTSKNYQDHLVENRVMVQRLGISQEIYSRLFFMRVGNRQDITRGCWSHFYGIAATCDISSFDSSLIGKTRTWYKVKMVQKCVQGTIGPPGITTDKHVVQFCLDLNSVASFWNVWEKTFKIMYLY